MLNALNKLWSALFVVVVNFVLAVVAGALLYVAGPLHVAGTNVFLTLWIIGIGSHGPIRWISNTLAFSRRALIWGAAFVVALITYLGVEVLAASLLRSGYGWRSVQLGLAANPIGMMVAPVVSSLLVRHLSGRSLAASTPTVTRQMPQGLNVQNAGQIQTGGPTVASRRVGGAALEPPIIVIEKEGRSIGHAWRVAFFACAVALAAFLIGDVVRDRYQEVAKPQASTGNQPNQIAETLSLMDGGHPLVAPVARLSIDALLAEYQQNEFAAAAKYENVDSLRLPCLLDEASNGCRVVEIAGVLREMGRTDRGQAYITLATTDQFVVVEARFGKAEHESLQTLRRGQRVTIRCMVLYDTTSYRASAGLSLTRCGVAPSMRPSNAIAEGQERRQR